MRQIGTLKDEAHAQRFSAWLVTQGVPAHAEPENGSWAIWVRNEEQVDRARGEMEAFRANPASNKYDGAESQAQSIAREEERRRIKAAKNVIEMRGNWSTAAGGVRHRTLTLVLIAISVVMTIVCGFHSPAANSFAWRVSEQMRFVSVADFNASDQDGLASLKKLQLWRLVTPIFVHGDIMHLVFNMLWLFLLGSQIESRKGPVVLGLMVLAVAAISNLLPALYPFDLLREAIEQANARGDISDDWARQIYPSVHGMGFSGVVYGMLGYAWMKMWLERDSGFYVSNLVLILMIGWIVAGFSGLLALLFNMGNIDHWAHLLGLLIGIPIGAAPWVYKRIRQWLNSQ